MTQMTALANWRMAAGPWAHFMKPSLLAAAEAGADPLPATNVALGWEPKDSDVAAVLDLPALESISAGVALGRQGWCVVPMFNTVQGPSEVLPTWEIVRALLGAAQELPEKPSGPPVFLLDSARRENWKLRTERDFDNRWYVFPSDFPSAEFFAAHGVSRLLVVVRGARLKTDLRDALAGHAALEPALVNLDDGREAPFPAPRAVIWREIAQFGRALQRNRDGTFGYRISHG